METSTSVASRSQEKKQRTPLSVTREKTLRLAQELFQRNGIQAVSVDAIAKVAGIKKMTLYRCFPSKAELVSACLQEWETTFQTIWEQSCSRFPTEPARQIHAFFEDIVQKNTYIHGCVFVQLTAEYPDETHPVRSFIRTHKAALRTRIRTLLMAADASELENLTDSICLLLDGLYAASQTFGSDSAPVRNAPNLVEKMLRQGCGSGAFPPVHRVFRRW